MVTNQEISRRLDSQEERIDRIEEVLDMKSESFDDAMDSALDNVRPKKKDQKKEPAKNETHLNFNQVITFLGVIAIVVGLISFFLYAVANEWIGETLQIMMGVLAGFVLFAFAFFLHKKNVVWSNIVFGSSFLVEYITISFGVLGYEVMPGYLGLFLVSVFLLSSTALSVYFASRSIAYLTLLGGFLVPLATGLYEYDLFILVFYTILSFGIVSLSFWYNWADLRFSTLAILSLVLLGYTDKFAQSPVKPVILFILLVIVAIYHVSSLIGSLKGEKEGFSVLDSISIAYSCLVFLLIVFSMYEWSTLLFGGFVMPFSLLFLIEAMVIGSAKKNVSPDLIYSLVGTGLVILNLGFYLIVSDTSLSFNILLVFFAVEYVITSLMSGRSKQGKLYNLLSVVFLVLTFFMYVLTYLSGGDLARAVISLMTYIAIVGSYLVLAKRGINFKLNAACFIIGGFLTIGSLPIVLLKMNVPLMINEIILSTLLLVYTLVLFYKVDTSEGKTLVGVLLGLTLLKIATKDLLYLDGVYRIVGFIVFGILLLVGGYVMSKNG